MSTFAQSESGAGTRTGTQSSTTSDNRSATGTKAPAAVGLTKTSSGWESSIGTSTDSHGYASSESYVQTSSGADGNALVETGAWANGSYGLSSFAQDVSSGGCFSLQETGTASSTGTGSRSGSDNALGTATTTGNALSGASSMSLSETAFDNSSIGETFGYAGTASYSLNQSGSDLTTWHQAGAFAGYSFSLNSVTIDQSATGSESFAQGATQSLSGTALLSSSAGAARAGSQGVAGPQPASVALSGSEGSLYTGSYDYAALASQTTAQSSAGSYARHEEGTFADGLYAFNTFALAQSGASTFGDGSGSSQTIATAAQGSFGATSSLALSSTPAAGGGSTSQTGSANRGGTQSYSSTQAQSSQMSEQGTASYTSYQEGNFANGSYSLASVLYDESSSQSYAQSERDGLSESTTKAGNNTASNNASSLAMTNSTSDPQGGTALESLTQTGQDTHGLDASGQAGLTKHEEGTFGNGSYSLGSVLYVQWGSDSSTEGRSDLGTATLLGSSNSFSMAPSSNGSLSGTGSLSAGGTGSYVQTSTVNASSSADSSKAFH